MQQVEVAEAKHVQLYTVEDVAELLDVSKKLVYEWISDGVLPSKRLGPGGRLIRISRADMYKFINTDFRVT